MDVVILFNGLGNQMSQYSFYLNKKNINKHTYIINFCNSDHNGFELENVFNIKFRRDLFSFFLKLVFKALLTNKVPFLFKPIKLLLNNLNVKIIKENFDYSFKSVYLIPSRGIYFYFGGWHHESYFEPMRSVVSKTFEFNITNVNDLKSLINDIENTESVAIHVRRGDYLNNDNMNLFGGVCDKEYFQKAMDFISNNVENPHYYIFSNDPDWVKLNFKFDNFTYVTNNQGKDSWKDMYLMSICKHNIISNSTFSWWGAWLNKNINKIVVSPDRFILNDIKSDIYPPKWNKINRK